MGESGRLLLFQPRTGNVGEAFGQGNVSGGERDSCPTLAKLTGTACPIAPGPDGCVSGQQSYVYCDSVPDFTLRGGDSPTASVDVINTPVNTTQCTVIFG